MQPLYDPQDILNILRSPEQTKSPSVFIRLKSLALQSSHHLKQAESWVCMKTICPLKTGLK